MEEDERKQKLRAGKEKLAQFQKKKKKHKSHDTEPVGTFEKTSSAPLETVDTSHQSSLAANFVYDSDSQWTSSVSEEDTSGTEDGACSRAYASVKAKLQEKSTRVEELEESLMGKQLALDKVIQENDTLRDQSSISQKCVEQDNENPPAITAEYQDSIVSQGSKIVNQSELPGTQSIEIINGAENHSDNKMADFQELVMTVQWLKLQLNQASGTLQAQNDKQKCTVTALQLAKDEILVLQDSITQKDSIVTELAEKLTIVSTEYGSFKQEYVNLVKNEVDDRIKELEEKLKQKELREMELLAEIKNVEEDKVIEVERIKTLYDGNAAQLTKELNSKVEQLESENVNILKESNDFQAKSDELIREIADLNEKNDILTKDLNKLEEENEKLMSVENQLKVQMGELQTLNADILNEKEDLKAQLAALEIQNVENVSDFKSLEDQFKDLQIVKNNSEDQLKELNDNFETKQRLHDELEVNYKNATDELEKLTEDNVMYQTQIEEYEDKISQSGDFMEENHSLRIQNDELYNKINNQKDVIASIKGELGVVSVENAQVIGQLSELSICLESCKEEIANLNTENGSLKSTVDELTAMLEKVNSENVQYKKTNLSLDHEIQNLKQELQDTAESQRNIELHVEEAIQTEVLVNDVNQNFENKLKPVEELFYHQETIQIQPEIEERLQASCSESYERINPLENPSNSLVTSSLENQIIIMDEETESELPNVKQSCSEEFIVVNDCDSDTIAEDINAIENCDLVNVNMNANNDEKAEVEDNMDVVVKTYSLSSAKDETEKGRSRVVELENELSLLKSELLLLRSENTVTESSNGAIHKVKIGEHQNVADASELLESNVKSTDSEIEDTLQKKNKEISDLKQSLETIQLEFDNISQELTHQNEECETLRKENVSLKEPKSESSRKHTGLPEIESSCNDLPTFVNSQTTTSMLTRPEALDLEVSGVNLPRLEASESEVNMHASSNPSSQHGIGQPLVPCSLVVSVGDVPNENKFQAEATRVVDGGENDGVEVQDTNNKERASNQMAESNTTDGNTSEDQAFQKLIKETENLKCDLLASTVECNKFQKEIICLKEMIKEKEQSEDELNVLVENQNAKLTKLKQLQKTSQESIDSVEERILQLTKECDEVGVLNDELTVTNQNLSKQLLLLNEKEKQTTDELALLIEKVQDAESKVDLFEQIKVKNENLIKDYENLQGYLSAKVEENNHISITSAALRKENTDLLANLKVLSTELDDLQKKVNSSESVNKGLNEMLSNISEEKESQEKRYMSEIEGLVEENSTLKTKNLSKETEIETLNTEIERLKGFFVNIDEQTQENNILRNRNIELESKFETTSEENEGLVCELMDTQEKLSLINNENEILLDKCDEFQTIVADLDDEKTGLLEEIEKAQGSLAEKLEEKDLIIVKYESQLDGLDEENATLKTQVLSLKQDLREVLTQAESVDESFTEKADIVDELENQNESLSNENKAYKAKIESMECDLLGLIEQVQLYDDTLVEKADLATRLEEKMNEILKENESLKCQCSSLEKEQNTLKQNEMYLSEQLKIYEHNRGSEETSSGEIERLHAQLELEMKYKHKLQNDVEHAQSIANYNELEKKQLTEKIEKLESVTEKQEKCQSDNDVKIHELEAKLETAEMKRSEIQQELKKSLSENKITLKEKESLLNEIGVLQGHLQAVSENRNHIRNQVEILAAEMDDIANNRDVMTSQYYAMEIDNQTLKSEHDEVKSRLMIMEQEKEELIEMNIHLREENKDIRSQFGSIQERLDKVDDILERNIDIESQNSLLNKRVEELNVRLDTIQKEKNEIEALTEELTSMLRDMQNKYEEVKSEMDNTKKKCDKEIGQLQSQLQLMNDDVGELRKMLDYMENEMYSAAEEKTVLKENLEVQQAHLDEVVEQKQKLENIVSEKQQKDIKNMKMVSQLNQQSSMTNLRVDQEQAGSDLSLVDSVNLLGDIDNVGSTDSLSRSESVGELNFEIEQILEETTVPAFSGALQMFLDSQNAEDTALNVSVQTNISVGEFENSGFLIDDNGENHENLKESNIVDCYTQTEMSIEAMEREVIESETNDSMNEGEIRQMIETLTDSSNYEESTLYETANETALNDMTIDTTENLDQNTDFKNQSTQTDELISVEIFVPMEQEYDYGNQMIQTQSHVSTSSTSCQCELLVSAMETLCSSPISKSATYFKPITDEMVETETDTSLMLDMTQNFSVASIDSGVYSAAANTDRSGSMFKYSEKHLKDHKDIFETETQNVIAKCEEISSNCIEIQTDLGLTQEMKEEMEVLVLKLETEFEEKTISLEEQLESQIMKRLEFRENKVKLSEESYEQKVKAIEYEIEEQFQRKFRVREVEIAIQAEKDIRENANEVNAQANRRIEQIKKEKDKQFVETLQKVRADLKKKTKRRRHDSDVRRSVSYDDPGLDTGSKPAGPAGDNGDARPQTGDDSIANLKQENKDLESYRDILLQKIDITRQEQEVLQGDLLSIMGEHTVMGNPEHSANQEAPSWLDWGVVPELSFGSEMSVMDQKSLSGSLDPSSFCTNNDCLAVRMRYEQVIDKIKQFLKIKSNESATISQPLNPNDNFGETLESCDSPDSERYEDAVEVNRFVESQENDSQMLQRLTSIDLEHFVRVPKDTVGHGSLEDQFVQENDNETNVLKGLVNTPLVQLRKQNEGHFSEHESDDSNDEYDGGIEHVLPKKQQELSNASKLMSSSAVCFSQVRGVAASVTSLEGGHFSEDNLDDEDDTPPSYRKHKRHYSESDANFLIEYKFNTSQSDNTEGHFVVEKNSDSNTLKKVINNDKEIREENVETLLSQEMATKELLTHTSQILKDSTKSKTKVKKQKKPKSLKISKDRFVVESSPMDERPPGTEDLNLRENRDKGPLTGEESGDFFQEKEEKKMTVIQKSMKASFDLKPMHEQYNLVNNSSEVTTPTNERADSGDILETIRQEIQSDNYAIRDGSFVTETGDGVSEHFECEENFTCKTSNGSFVSDTRADGDNKLLDREGATSSGDLFMENVPSVDQEKSNKHSEQRVVNDNIPKLDTMQPHTTPIRRDLVDAPKKLNSDFSAVKPQYSEGKQSYENTVFDMLNSICPGTDPTRIQGFRSESLPPVLQHLESTTSDFSESPIENELSEILLKCNNLEKLVQEVKVENQKLEKELKENNSELEKSRNLIDKVNVLEIQNTELNKRILDSTHQLNKLQELKHVNQILKSQVDEFGQKEKVFAKELSNKQQMESNYEANVQIHELKEANDEYEKALQELSKENNELIDNSDLVANQLKALEDNVKELTELKTKLTTENESLKTELEKGKAIENDNSELIHKLKMLEKEKNELSKLLQTERNNFQVAKEELENTIIAQDDQYKKLGEQNNDEHSKLEIDKLTNEVTELSAKLAAETNIKVQLKNIQEELNEEVSQLKTNTNDMTDAISELKEENDILRTNLIEKDEEIKKSKEEKDCLNIEIQKLTNEKQNLNEILGEKEIIFKEQTVENEKLNEAIQELFVKTDELGCEVNEKSEMLTKYMEENERLKCVQNNMEQLVIENNQLKQISNKSKELNNENEWAIKELSLQVEQLETEKAADKETMKVLSKKVEDIAGQDMHTFTEDLDSLRKERDCLKRENVTLQEKLDHLEEKSDSEASETEMQILEDLKAALKSLQCEKKVLEKQNQTNIELLANEKQTLQCEISDLQTENKNSLKQSKSIEENLRKENTDILKMYSDLRNEVEVLVISKHDLEVELHALKDLLEQESGPISPVRTEHDTSRELTLQDLEEMEELKNSIDKLKTDMKEKDNYVRKLEEHLLNVDRGLPNFNSSPKPVSSHGEPTVSRGLAKRKPWLDFGRRAFSHDLPEISIEHVNVKRDDNSGPHESAIDQSDLDSTISEGYFVEGLGLSKDWNVLTSSVQSDARSVSSIAESYDGSERIKSGLGADEDGHLALELKQYELVDEIGQLRRDFRETKAVYAQETALLTEALEREKIQKERLHLGSNRGKSEMHSYSSVVPDTSKLRLEIAQLKAENKLLRMERERGVEMLRDQEGIVSDMRERLSRNTSGIEEIEEVFGRQLALLQKQREELLDKLKDREMENVTLSVAIGEKGIIEDTLRREKDILVAKLHDKENIELQLNEKKFALDKLSVKQKEYEEIINQKDRNEIELMKQKRLLQEELHEIESKFRDREENLGYEKNKLLDELREAKGVRNKSRLSESEDENKSVCSDSSFSDRNIGRLEIMLEEVEQQHQRAVKTLREQLNAKYSRRERTLREEHGAGLDKYRTETNKQVK